VPHCRRNWPTATHLLSLGLTAPESNRLAIPNFRRYSRREGLHLTLTILRRPQLNKKCIHCYTKDVGEWLVNVKGPWFASPGHGVVRVHFACVASDSPSPRGGVGVEGDQKSKFVNPITRALSPERGECPRACSGRLTIGAHASAGYVPAERGITMARARENTRFGYRRVHPLARQGWSTEVSAASRAYDPDEMT